MKPAVQVQPLKKQTFIYAALGSLGIAFLFFIFDYTPHGDPFSIRSDLWAVCINTLLVGWFLFLGSLTAARIIKNRAIVFNREALLALAKERKRDDNPPPVEMYDPNSIEGKLNVPNPFSLDFLENPVGYSVESEIEQLHEESRRVQELFWHQP